MTDLIAVLLQNIFPIFLVAAFGYGLQRWVKLDVQTLSRAVLYVLSPALVFSSLVSSRLPAAELGSLALFTLLSVTVMGLIGWGAARFLRFGRGDTAALMLMLMFVNGGNYGLTLNQLRYGDDGLARAVVYYTTSTVILYTVGIFIASLGQLSWRDALNRLLRMPPIYAAVLAVVVYSFQIPVPAPLLRGIEVAGAGAIPVLLLVLGMQMARARGQFSSRLALPTIALRLLLAPIVAVGIAQLLGLQGLGRATSIVEASMPPAVFTIVLATEFGLQPTAVTGVVVLATLFSPFTIAAAITLLGL